MRALILLCALLFGVTAQAETRTAIFAGGCFWCMESDYEKLDGVSAVESGYIGGRSPDPTYAQVSRGGTGYAEAVRVTYDADKVGYTALLDYFWRHIDPTVKDRQFCDSGSQYRSGIYFQNPEEEKLARESLAALEKSGRFARIYTEIEKAGTFYPAEEYHQDYYKKNPLRYHYYRHGCGRDARIKALWGEAH